MSNKFTFLESKINFKELVKLNPFISSDYHIFKEYRIDNTSEEQKKIREKESREVIKLHNQIVGKDDLFLFLGDLTEEEFSDKKYENIVNYLKSKVKELNGYKIIIRGNNDSLPDKFYLNCGFVEVVNSKYIETDEYLFSHYPLAGIEKTGKLNIHGHIHGSKNYWGMKCENHLDCYYKLWNGPIKLNDLVSKYSEYQKGCKSNMKEKAEVYYL